MGKRKSVPKDLMGNILSESFDTADEGETFSGSRGSADIPWDERPERVGIAFNLSKQLGAELEDLRWELRSEEDDARPSRSEIAEVALRIAVEDVRERGGESELARRLAGLRGARVPDAASRTTRRSVDESGLIFETTFDENGNILDEDVVGAVADLPVSDEYVDEQGRLVSVARDELGNTFEQVMDEGFNTLATRLLPVQDRDAP